MYSNFTTIYKNDLYNGKDVFLKEGENAWYYINQGYKVHIPKGFAIYANTGEIIKDKNYKTQEDIIHELRKEIEG